MGKKVFAFVSIMLLLTLLSETANASSLRDCTLTASHPNCEVCNSEFIRANAVTCSCQPVEETLWLGAYISNIPEPPVVVNTWNPYIWYGGICVLFCIAFGWQYPFLIFGPFGIMVAAKMRQTERDVYYNM